jgi:hypothetical protein
MPANETTPIHHWFSRIVEGVNDTAVTVVRDAVVLGEDLMQQGIEYGGTLEQWTRADRYGRWSSDPGRVASGKMLDAVESDMEVDDNHVRGEFGWIDNYEDYFGFQEAGFYHVRAQREVASMHALSDAAEAVFEFIDEELDTKL